MNGKLLISIIGGATLLALAAAGGGLKQTWTNTARIESNMVKIDRLPEKVAGIEADVSNIKDRQKDMASDIKEIKNLLLDHTANDR